MYVAHANVSNIPVVADLSDRLSCSGTATPNNSNLGHRFISNVF